MLLGICGFAGSGKNTVGQILCDEFFSFEKYSFTDSLKDSISSIFSWDRNLLQGETDESRIFREKKDDYWSDKLGFDVTPRKIMQLFGTEIGRNQIHPNIWIYSIESKILNNAAKNAVITDVRFPNEIDYIRRNNGFIVRVVRGLDPEWYDKALDVNSRLDGTFRLTAVNIENLKQSIPSHYSEWAWIGQKMDYVLDNNNGIEELHANIKIMLKTFLGPANIYDIFS